MNMSEIQMDDEQKALYNELRKLLPIHIQSLHKDAQIQPDLAERAGNLAAELKAVAKQRRVDLDELEALLRVGARTKPSDFGLVKITENAVTEIVNSHEDYLNQKQVCIEADLAADLAASLATAIEHRRSMIKIEAQLYLSNYWGEVEVQKEMEEGMTAGIEQMEKRLANARNAKKKKETEA